MFTLKNIQTSLRGVLEDIGMRLGRSSRNGRALSIGMEVELVDGQHAGAVVELWVKTVSGFAPLSESSEVSAHPNDKDLEWFRSSEGYLEVWEDVASAEVAVHCIPFDQIAGTRSGRVVVTSGWKREQTGTLGVPNEGHISTARGEAVARRAILPMQSQQYGILHVDR
jgi:hypothetical protein